MVKSLLNYCEQLYVMINDIVKKTVEINANFFEKLKDFFDKFEKSAVIDDFSQAEIQSSKYALVALLDELISYYYPNVNHHWPARSLQLYYYQTNIAGHRFFENLDELLIDENKNRAVLEIYYFCLQLNFKGQYHSHDEKIEAYRQRLKSCVGFIDMTINSKNPRDQGVPIWLLMSIILFLILVLYAVFIIFANEKIIFVAENLGTYAEQLQDV